jgi:hypothetical protein
LSDNEAYAPKVKNLRAIALSWNIKLKN